MGAGGLRKSHPASYLARQAASRSGPGREKKDRWRRGASVNGRGGSPLQTVEALRAREHLLWRAERSAMRCAICRADLAASTAALQGRQSASATAKEESFVHAWDGKAPWDFNEAVRVGRAAPCSSGGARGADHALLDDLSWSSGQERHDQIGTVIRFGTNQMK